jgi:hypothetical protein
MYQLRRALRPGTLVCPLDVHRSRVKIQPWAARNRFLIVINIKAKKKVKISLLQAMEAHRVAERLRLPHYLDKRLIDGGKVVSPTRQPHFTPRFLYF